MRRRRPKQCVRMMRSRADTCPHKVRHPDEAAALRAVAEMVASARVADRWKPLLEAYRCPACGGWHVGRRRAAGRKGA